MRSNFKKIINKKNIFIIFTIFIFLLFFSIIFAILNITNEKINNGVFIQKINVSNLDCNEAKEKIEDIIKNKKIILKYQELAETIYLDEINIQYDIDNAIIGAYSVGRKNNIFKNNYEILKAKIFGDNINIGITYNEEELKEKIDNISSKLPDAVQEYSYCIDDNNLIITNGKEGITVNKKILLNEINKKIIDFSENSFEINIPVINKKPDKIDINKIHSEIYKEAQDAYITNNPTTVHPNVNGIDFDISIEEAKKIVEENKEEYTIPLKITIANKTVNDLGEEAFPDILGSFSTRYDASNKNRSNNISLASNKINGTVIMPGEVFSYNQIVGKRTIEAGYKEAGAYSGGKVVQEVGGGICQVSSTLYNAVLYANLDVVERSNHYFQTSYVDIGRDATVSWGTVDFKFKNNRKYPVKIFAEAKNGVNKISIKGIAEEKEYEVVIKSTTTSIIEKKTIYQEDENLEDGKEEIIQDGHDGATSKTYKILKWNGAEISSELISSDSYHALSKIINKGTKKDDESVSTN